MFVGLSSVLKNLSKALSFINGATGSLGFVMLGLGLSFLAMASAIAIIASVDDEKGKLGRAVGVIYGVLYACIALFKAMSKMNAFDVKTVADSIFTIALAIVVIAGAIALLSIPGVDYQQGLSVVGGIALGIAGIIWILSGTANPAKLEGVAATVMTMALAIDVIVGGLIALMYNVAAVESIKAGSVKQATDALYGIMGMMSIMVLALGGMAKISGGNKIAASIGTILAIASAIDILVGGVAALAAIAAVGNLGEAMLALLNIAAILAGFVGIAALCTKLPLKGLGYMSIMLGVAVGAISAMVGLVALLSIFDEGALKKAIEALFWISGILVALTIVMGFIAEVLLVTGAGEALIGMLTSLVPVFFSFASAASAFGFAIIALAGAAWIFVDAGTRLWALLKDIGDNGPEVFDKLATNISSAIPVLMAVATTHLPQFLTWIGEIILTVLDYIATYLPMIFDKILEIGFSYIPSFFAGVLKLITNLLETIANALPSIINALVLIIIALFNGLGLALQANSDALAAAIGNVLLGIFSVIGSLIKTFWNWWMSEEVQAFMYEVWDTIFGFFAKFDEIDKAVWDTILGIPEKVGEFFKGIWEDIVWTIMDIVDSIVYFFEGIFEFFKNLWNGLVGFVTGIPGAVTAFLIDIWTRIYTTVVNAITFLANLPKWIAQILVDTIMTSDNKFAEIIRKILAFWIKLNGYFARGVEKVKNFGIKFVTGFIDGIKGMVEKAKETVTGLAENVVGWFTGKDGLDEHSPSKKAEESGELFGQGFVNGLNGMLDPVKDATSGLAESATDTFDISGIQDDLDSTLGDNQYSIDIIPNIDYSQMTTTGEADYSNLWGGNLDASGLGVDGASLDLAQYTNADVTQAYDYEEPEPYDDTNVINAIKELNGKINAIAEGLSGMDVYLDKNVLVGEIAGPLDAELGRRSTRASRGSGR